MKRLCLSVVCVIALAAPSSLAATGFYLGGGLGNDVEGGSFRSGLEELSESSGDRSKLFAGVEIGRYVGVEVARYDFGNQRCCRFVADLGFDSEIDGESLAVLGRWPLRWATPFAKAGVLSWEEDGQFITLLGTSPMSADGEELLLGAGVDVRLVSVLNLRVEWERYEFGNTSTDGFWASAVIKFGDPARHR